MNKKITTNCTKEELRKIEELYLKGEVTNDEWSRMTVAMRIHLNRFLDKNKRKEIK